MTKNDNNNNKTSRARLSSIIKSARDIMRKDAGLNGELDRLPQLSWLLFLKFFDDAEQQREAEAVFTAAPYKPAIENPYRWSDWAADLSYGLTGDELLDFVNNDLIPYLRGLTGTPSRLVIKELFGEIDNRMRSGYLLRDVINMIDDSTFTSQMELHTLGAHVLRVHAATRCATRRATPVNSTPHVAVVRLMVECQSTRRWEKPCSIPLRHWSDSLWRLTHLNQQNKTAKDASVSPDQNAAWREKPNPCRTFPAWAR